MSQVSQLRQSWADNRAWPTSFLSFLTSSLSASQRVLPLVLSCRPVWKMLTWRDGGSFNVCPLCPCYPMVALSCCRKRMQISGTTSHNPSKISEPIAMYSSKYLQQVAAISWPKFQESNFSDNYKHTTRSNHALWCLWCLCNPSDILWMHLNNIKYPMSLMWSLPVCWHYRKKKNNIAQLLYLP